MLVEEFDFRTRACSGRKCSGCAYKNWQWQPTKPQRLHWYKSARGHWCSLRWLKLTGWKRNGVYIIWAPGISEPVLDEPALRGAPRRIIAWPRVIYVGSGNIAQRLRDHRSPDGFAWRDDGELLVTWAVANCLQVCRGFEAYLGNKLKPLGCERLPSYVQWLPVEPPFGWVNFRPPFSKHSPSS